MSATQLDLFEPLVDPNGHYEMMPWQERDLRFLSPMPSSANWGQMGTFKTSTLLWLMQRKKVRNALIVTSKVGKGAYFSDFYKCLPESWHLYNVGIHKATRRIEGFEKDADIDVLLEQIKSGKHNHPMILLLHYDCLTDAANKNSAKRDLHGRGILDKLLKIEWDLIAADEAHKLKNRKAQWTRNIKKLKARNKHIMTGTGFVNNPAEMWSLLNFLDRKEWSSYWNFRSYFCDEILDARGFRTIIGVRPYRVEEFRDLRKKLGPRHTMEEVHAHIRKPIEAVHEVELSSAQRRMYNEIKTYLSTLDQAGETLQSPNVLSQLNRLRQVCVATPKVLSYEWSPKQNRMVHEIMLEEPSSKLDEVMALLEEIDEHVVIFSNFKDPLKLLEKRFDKAEIGYLHMEQRHSEDQRYRMWHDQFGKTDHQVFMSTLSLGGESINLTAAKYLIFLDRSWSPKDMLQAVGRVYRPGQQHACEIIYINATKTVDGYVKSRLDTKGKWFAEIFDD